MLCFGSYGSTASTALTGADSIGTIPTNASIDGKTSTWTFRVAGSTNVTIGDGYTDGTFKAILSTVAQIAGTTKTVAGETVTNGSVASSILPYSCLCIITSYANVWYNISILLMRYWDYTS